MRRPCRHEVREYPIRAVLKDKEIGLFIDTAQVTVACAGKRTVDLAVALDTVED
jgi:hypothetical protein